MLCYGPEQVGFQTRVILDLWGMVFHAMVAFGLELDFLLDSISTYCEELQGVLQRSVILWKPRMPTKTIHGVRNMVCTCSLGMDICFFTIRMNFELRGWPPQPPTFSSNSTKITEKCTILNFSFDMLEAKFPRSSIELQGNLLEAVLASL